MRVILYQPDFTRPGTIGWTTTTALSEGLTKLGIEHSVRRTKHWTFDRVDGKKQEPNEIADICIVNGWWKKYIDDKARTNRNVIINAQDAAGKPAWCIERGFLGDRDNDCSAMSIGGFCSNGGDFRAEGMPPDRWEKMGIKLEPWKTGGQHILLAAQVPWDSQVQDGNHIEWLEKTIHDIRKYTDRPIVFRGHPKAWRQTNPYRDLSREVLSMVKHEPLNKEPRTTFEQDLQGAHAVVCFNSNVATLATVAGYPVFTGAQCLADPIACRDLSIIDRVQYIMAFVPREQWAWNLAYKQWSVEEFRRAEPWLHLMRPSS